MAEAPGEVVILTSCDSEANASAIARALVEERLAACVTRLPSARSIYRWEGKVEEAEELLLVIKTTARNAQATVRRVAELHPYQVPEVLVLPVLSGHAPYLDWLHREVAGSSGKP